MTKEDFHRLLQRYREGKCSTEELEQINVWFEKISDDGLELNEWQKINAKKRILAKINHQLSPVDESQSRNFSSVGLLKFAASLSVIVLVFYFLIDRPRRTFEPLKAGNTTLKEYSNSSGESMKILLPDGSAVELSSGGKIFLEENWNGAKREVHLIGEAFFDVVENARKPFFVYGGRIVTKVLGTSFSVNAPQDAEKIEVSVRTGKVSVYEQTDERDSIQSFLDGGGVILTPNERVQYYVKDRHWVTSLVDAPQPLPLENLTTSAFVFNGTPVKEIFHRIESGYDIDIIIENEGSYLCTFTGDVTMMQLFDMLQVVCKSIGATYQVKGTKILISGNGC